MPRCARRGATRPEGGGNPFFVTEVLLAREEELPVSVRDAVLARGPARPGGTTTPRARRRRASPHANSICVFSGQNDDPGAPLSLDESLAPNGPGGKSQSFGHDVKLGLDPHAFNPGDACRGGSNPDRQ